MATKAEIREYFAKFGKEGGKTRARNMSPQQRSEASRKASEARWAKIDSSLKEMTENLAKLNRKTKARKDVLKKKAKESE